MIKRTVSFKNLDGLQVKKDLYFNLSSVEIAELNRTHAGDIQAELYEVANSDNGLEMLLSLNEILVKAYGERNAEGDGFNKSDEISNKFKNSLAYDVLIAELVSDPAKAEEFQKGLLDNPVIGVATEIQEVKAEANEKVVDLPVQKTSAEAQLEAILASNPELAEKFK